MLALIAVAALVVGAVARAASPTDAQILKALTPAMRKCVGSNKPTKAELKACAFVVNGGPTTNPNPAGQNGATPGVASGIGNTVQNPAAAAGGVASAAGNAIAGGLADQVTGWATSGAKSMLELVDKASRVTSAPELTSGWFANEFQFVAIYGGGFAAIALLAALGLAALKRDSDMLGAALYAVMRAGFLTATILALTQICLAVSDGIANDIYQQIPQTFFTNLSGGWGSLGAGLMTFLAALFAAFVGLLLWIELIFRDAILYLALAFFPLALGMAIFPRFAATQAKLLRIIGIGIALKPAVLLGLLTGAAILSGGLGLTGGAASIGTVLAGIVVLALAAFAPWVLMHLISHEAGSMSAGAARRVEAGTVVGGELNASSSTSAGGSLLPAAGGASGRSLTSDGVSSNSTGAAAGGGAAKSPMTFGAIAAAAGAVVGAAQNVAQHGQARLQAASGTAAPRRTMRHGQGSARAGHRRRRVLRRRGSRRPRGEAVRRPRSRARRQRHRRSRRRRARRVGALRRRGRPGPQTRQQNRNTPRLDLPRSAARRSLKAGRPRHLPRPPHRKGDHRSKEQPLQADR